MRFKIFVISTLILLCSETSFALRLVNKSAFQSTLRGIKNEINSAVAVAEDSFIYNNGNNLPSVKNLKNQEYDGYLQTIEIQTDYKIRFKFISSTSSLSIHKDLLNKKILLIPIYTSGDQQISRWECITNADEDITPFKGSSSPESNKKSIISRDDIVQNSSLYLTNCIYVEDSVLSAVDGLWPDS